MEVGGTKLGMSLHEGAVQAQPHAFCSCPDALAACNASSLNQTRRKRARPGPPLPPPQQAAVKCQGIILPSSPQPHATGYAPHSLEPASCCPHCWAVRSSSSPGRTRRTDPTPRPPTAQPPSAPSWTATTMPRCTMPPGQTWSDLMIHKVGLLCCYCKTSWLTEAIHGQSFCSVTSLHMAIWRSISQWSQSVSCPLDALRFECCPCQPAAAALP